MKDFFIISLQNFLYNAGILGFIKILDYGNCSRFYKFKGNEVFIDKALFLDDSIDLAFMYYSALRNEFQDGTVYQSIVNMNDQLKNNVLSNEALEELLIKLKVSLHRNSYKSGYEIAKKNGIEYDPLLVLKVIQEITDYKKKVIKTIELTQYILDYPEIFCFKDIAYTKISKIWNNISFLYPQNSKKDMIKTHHNVFVKPIREWINKQSKAKVYCVECGINISISYSNGLSWLHDMGVDHKRKNSYFWNFKPDSYLCPLCAFIYSCSPLGFSYSNYGNDCIFINNSESLVDLQRDNISSKGDIEAVIKDEGIDRLTYRLINRIINEQLQQKQKNELSNIQVIMKKQDRGYDISLLNKYHLAVIKECGKELEKLSGIYLILPNNRKLYIFEECINNLINGYSQYGLINIVIRKGFSDGDYIGYVRYLLKIQRSIKSNKKGGKTMITDKMIFAISQAGIRMRGKFANKDERADKKDNVDNKLRGFAYQLLNALQVGDCSSFLSITTRMYIGMGEPIPNLFIRMINNEETFKSLGYAYVLGLKGTSEEKVVDKNLA